MRQKIGVKNLGNISMMNKEMEDIFDSFSQSGKLNLQERVEGNE